MADAPPQPALHPTDRLIGTAPAVASLRARFRHLASFDAVGSRHVPTLLPPGRDRHRQGPGGARHPRQCTAGHESRSSR